VYSEGVPQFANDVPLYSSSILYCCHLYRLQYTLYPEGLVPQLVDEVSAAFDWAMEHVQQYGGDAQQVMVVGLR
jgi:sugar (pentulose or hexulose) kinase